MPHKIVRTFFIPPMLDKEMGRLLALAGVTGNENPTYTAYEKDTFDKVGYELVVLNKLPAAATEDEILTLVSDADAVIALHAALTRRVIEGMNKCRVIYNIGIGYDTVDIQAATDAGILVTNDPEFCLDEVSDQAMALILNLIRRINRLDKAIRSGKAGFPEIAAARGQILATNQQILGLVGLGNIAQKLAVKAKPFGFRVIAYSPHVPEDTARKIGVEIVGFEKLLHDSDVISVHTSMTPDKKHMFGIEEFKKMKPTAYFVNTARGALVNEKDLCQALIEGIIAGAGLDVTEQEPIPVGSPILKMDNVILSGHTGSYSETSHTRQWRKPPQEIVRILSGNEPRTLINPEVRQMYEKKWGTK